MNWWTSAVSELWTESSQYKNQKSWHKAAKVKKVNWVRPGFVQVKKPIIGANTQNTWILSIFQHRLWHISYLKLLDLNAVFATGE